MLQLVVISVVIGALIIAGLRRLGMMVTPRTWVVSIVGTMFVIALLWARAHG